MWPDSQICARTLGDKASGSVHPPGEILLCHLPHFAPIEAIAPDKIGDRPSANY
ncbi:MAG TPA: hypothetical protein V6C88_16405 [Chroococcidiopsis sp.]